MPASRSFYAGVAALLAGWISCGHAQTPPAQTDTGPQARRDELAKTVEMVADPDPLQRLANMEAIIASHDALRIQLAIKSALASDDPQMRAMAMNAYMASIKTIVFDIHLPEAVLRVYDPAGDEDQTKQYESSHTWLYGLHRIGFQLVYNITNFSINSLHGKAETNAGSDLDFVIAGDKAVGQERLDNIGTCNIEFRPTRSLTIAGILRCPNIQPMAMTAQLF